MRYIVAALLGLALLGLVLTAVERLTPEARARAELANQAAAADLYWREWSRRQAAEDREATQAAAQAAMLWWIGAGSALGTLTAAGVIALALGAGMRQVRKPITYTTPEGHLLTAQQLLSGAVLHLPELAAQGTAIAAIEAARRPAAPSAYTYAPRITQSPTLPVVGNYEPSALPVAPLPGVTDLADLLPQYPPAVDGVLLGLLPGGAPARVPLAKLLHVALVGATGGGKSNTLRLLLGQLLALHCRVILVDPHYADVDPDSGDDWRPIRRRLLFEPARTPRAMADALTYAADELHRRLDARAAGDPIGPPLFVAYDELPALVKAVPAAPELLGDILRQGRKVHVLALGASQAMLIKAVGGDSSLRDNYRTAVYVGGDVRSASALLDLPQRNIDDGALGAGVALVRSHATTPPALVRVPLVSNAALARLLPVGDVATSPPTSPPSRGGLGEVAAEVASEVGTSDPLRPHPDALDARAARVRAMLLEKRSQNEILETVWNAKSGERYQRAADEYRTIVARLVREKG